MANGPATGLNLLSALGRLLCQCFPGRFGRIGGSAQARDHYLGQPLFVSDSIQGLADFDLDSGGFGRIADGDFGALQVLLEGRSSLIRDL